MVQSWPPNGLDSNESLTQSLSLKPQDNKRSALFKRSHFKVPYSLMMGKLKISEVTINSFILRPEFDGQPCPKPCPCPSLLRCSCPRSQSFESNWFNLIMQCHEWSLSDQGIETKFCKRHFKFVSKISIWIWEVGNLGSGGYRLELKSMYFFRLDIHGDFLMTWKLLIYLKIFLLTEF